ncbi:MAG: hypothetical protein C0398_07335 [Coprothermobacter sp.]|nr:hypothetical protein [Coprothermobacter sp.]
MSGGVPYGQPERVDMTTETAARPPKVLIISQGAPGVGKDANSIMLWRLLKYFPANSYMVLSSNKNWPDGRVPQAQREDGHRCFVGSVVRSGIGGSGGETFSVVHSTHSTLRILKDWLWRPVKSVLHRIVDPVSAVVQTWSAAGTATAIVENEEITSILAISDVGPCLMAGWIAHGRTGIPLDLFIYDLWRGNVLSWFQQLMASLFQRRVLAASRRVFSGSEGVCEYLDAELGIESVVVRNSVIARGVTSVGSRSVSGSPMVVLYTGGVYWAQLDAILDLIAAVRDMVDIEFHIYSRQSQGQLAVMGVTGNNVVVHQGLPEDEVRDRQATADVLYLPMSFGKKGRLIIATAQPAKSVEYMASGVPVLVHAPAYAFATRYAREHDIAIVVDQPGPDELTRVLMALISDRTDAQRKAARAAELASKSHDSLEVSHLLQSYLLYERA